MGKGTALAKAPKGRYPATSSIKPAPASHRQAEQGPPKGNPHPTNISHTHTQDAIEGDGMVDNRAGLLFDTSRSDW